MDNQKKNAFFQFYEELLGNRWESLYKGLTQPSSKTPLLSPFDMGPPYEIDPASQAVITNIPFDKGPKAPEILDLCSAPGGKALFSFFLLKGQGTWTLNDLSKERFKRLTRTFKERVPEEYMDRIYFKNRDGSRWGQFYPNQYDYVILDAPCSSEQHLINSPSLLQKWSTKRTKGLAQRQYALLCSALQTVKSKGFVMYSTCSVSSLENDQVIEKLIKKNKINVQILPLKKSYENTKYGSQIWPDKYPGQGPIYMCLLQKV